MGDIIFGLIVISASVCAVIGLGLTIHWSNKREVGILPYFVYPALAVTIIAVLTSNRDMSIPLEFVHANAKEVKGPLMLWAGRLNSMYLVFAFGERLIHRIFSSGQKQDFPVPLMVGLTIFFLTNIISPAFFGSYPSISHENFYAFFVLAGAVMMNEKEAAIAIKSTRNAYSLFMLAGLICIIFKPSLVLQTNYHGLIPFLNIRLAGFASHPNGLGVIAVVFLLVLWHSPFSSRVLNNAAWLLGLANLLLAQSKTSWVAFLLCALSIYIFAYGHLIKQQLLNFRRYHFPVTLIASVMVFSVMVCTAIMFFDVGDKLSSFLGSRTGSELASFSGRDVIWQIALEEWHRNPIFGYGLKLFDDDYRISIHMSNATTAHSQFYQSLAQSGVIGFAGLIIYLLILTYYTLMTIKISKGLSLAFFYVIMSECFAEVPFLMDTFGAEPVITHSMLLIALAIYYEMRRKKTSAVEIRENHLINRNFA